MGKSIREGHVYRNQMVVKVTPQFHRVLLWLEDEPEPVCLGDQDWVHVEELER